MAELLTVYEPYDRFLTTDQKGRVRQWAVKPDGLVVIMAGTRFEAESPLEQQGRDQEAEQ